MSQRRVRRIATALVLALSTLAALFPPTQRNQNFREKHMLEAGWRIARGEGVSKVLARQYPGYDIGTPLLLGATMRLTMSPDALATGPPSEAPRLYNVLHRAAFPIAATILFTALLQLATPFTAAAGALLMLAAPDWRFIAYSNDVYVFPAYALALTLLALAVMPTRSRRAWPLILLCAAGVGVCAVFRNVSVLCLSGALAVALWPAALFDPFDRKRIRTRSIVFVVVAVACAVLPGKLIGADGHAFWHPPHCGLGEFGGHEDAEARLYPWFVPSADLPDSAVPIVDWNDQRSFRRARHAIPGVQTCSAEYEALMRSDYFASWRDYPLGMTLTYARRTANVLSLSPVHRHEADSRIRPSTAYWVGFAVMPLVLLGAWRARMPRRAWFMLAAFAPMLIAPILVHSGYVMYNAPAQLPLYVFAFWTIGWLVQRPVRARVA